MWGNVSTSVVRERRASLASVEGYNAREMPVRRGPSEARLEESGIRKLPRAAPFLDTEIAGAALLSAVAGYVGALTFGTWRGSRLWSS
jgi:hypothetical protein